MFEYVFTSQVTRHTLNKSGPFSAFHGISPASGSEKSPVDTGQFFPASTAEKTTVDAGKNGPVPTGVFSLPEAGKVRRTAVKGLDFLTVHVLGEEGRHKS